MRERDRKSLPSKTRHPAVGSQRIRPLDAWRSLRRLIQDPDDTTRVFEIIDALSGRSGERQLRRFRLTEVGQRVLSEERDILDTLSDRDALLAMPDGSLGYTYAAFMQREQLTADGLVAASEQGGGRPEEVDRQRFGARLRDTHDLWHMVTGYNRDLIGEASLLSFTLAQTHNPGIGLIVAMAYAKSGGDLSHGRRMIREAFGRGRRAAWLPAADWEQLLPQPLDEVRQQLGLDEPPVYQEVRSEAAEAALAAH